jgi:hypothetical protein
MEVKMISVHHTGCLVLGFLLGGGISCAQEVMHADEGLTFAWTAPDRLEITVLVPEATVETTEHGAVLRFASATGVGHPGEPALPMLVAVLEDPPPGEVVIDWQVLDKPEERILTVAPISTRRNRSLDDQVFVLETVSEPDLSIYTDDAFWPESPVSVSRASMGARRLLRIAVIPLTYNPILRTVRFPEKMSVTLTFQTSP